MLAYWALQELPVLVQPQMVQLQPMVLQHWRLVHLRRLLQAQRVQSPLMWLQQLVPQLRPPLPLMQLWLQMQLQLLRQLPLPKALAHC